MSDLKEKLQPLLKGEIFDDEQTLEQASHDASLFEVKPKLVIAPQDSEDIKALVRFANENPGISLTARSAATDMSGGPLNESIILDFTKHFNQVKEVGEGYAITQPGVFYRDFEKQTLAKGWLMPSYPASREICTVGGMVANNSGGEKTLSYGQTKNYVQKLKAVLSDGNEYEIQPLSKEQLEAKMNQGDFEGGLYKELHQLLEDNYEEIQQHKPTVSKNSAGYFLWDVWDRSTFDLTKLITGSQGTLGLISEITFRLIKPKPHSKLLVIFLHDLKPLGKIAEAVVQCGPESFESYDDKTLKLALRFLPDLVSYMGKGLFSLAWQFLPEAWMAFMHGLPRLVLMAEFTGDTEEEVDKKLEQAR
ncbi:MAG: FAD-binding oxidoreductase, partial [Candidatus Yanofskybacteria bacterium]|nr:FAD-binding oxidoreductase [Candidatus Yanofskybacteria bacterium]